MQKLTRICRAALVSAVLAAGAHGSTITISDTSSGWYTSDASNNYFAFGTENYLAGYCSLANCAEATEYRNFFTFTIPDFAGAVTSAVLTINTGGTDLTQNATATYQLSSLPDTFGFSDIGAGTVYGTLSYSAASADADEQIVLNSSAIAGINADSTFAAGGVVSNLQAGATNDQYLFGADGIGSGDVELTITTGNLSVQTVPEPAAIGLFGLGAVALGAAGKWIRKRAG